MRALVLGLLSACTAASPELGYDAPLQVRGAQFRPGPFPDDEFGPAVLAASTAHPTITIGTFAERLKSALAPSATAAIIGIDGFDGSWILRAGPPDIDTPGSPSANAIFALTHALPAGGFMLLVAATDAQGRTGAPLALPLVAEDAPIPDGELVVALTWSSRADLDLHVVDPLGREVWSGDPNTYEPPPPGEPVDPNAYLAGGILDHDGNAECHRDGNPSEHVIWKMRTGSNGPVAPDLPPGEYVVRVDTRAMCGDASAAWAVTVYEAGMATASARGWSVPDDTLHTHGAGAGVTALRFVR